MEAKLDPIFKAAIDAKEVAGVAAVLLDGSGRVLFGKGYGRTTIDDENSPEVNVDTPTMIWSCTKLLTSIACLQLIEQGKLKLDDAAEKYVPDIKQIKVLEGFNEDGSPILRESKGTITILNLFTHTSGMAYDFIDVEKTFRYRVSQSLPPVSLAAISAKNNYMDPLIFEPGAAYHYGPNVDWLGFIVEKISGLTLAEYVDKYIIGPLGLKNITSTYPPDLGKHFMFVHAKDSTGALVPTPTKIPSPAEVPFPGGHYLYGSAMDYANVLVTIVNDGTHPISGVQILKSETCKDLVFKDLIPCVGCSPDGIGIMPPGAVPPVTNSGELLPGVKKGWSCGLMINNEDMPNGRPAGSGAWAGLGNSYYWIDPKNKLVGMLASSSLPFLDRDILHLFDALERAAYKKPQAKEKGEVGSNFSGGINKNDPEPSATPA